MRGHFDHDGLRLHYLDSGAGLPFVFQHGLGGDVDQPAGLFRPPPGVRLLACDSRGHGNSPVGIPERIGFDVFADDVCSLLDWLEIEQAVVGGVSMGAGVALNLAVRHPERVKGLVMSRPAWLGQPLPDHLKVYLRIADLIHLNGPDRGLALFRASDELKTIAAESPDSAASLVKQFEHPRAEEAVTRLYRIPADVPYADLQAVAALDTPTLVLGNRRDPIHPFTYAEELSRLIPGATFAELTPKSVDTEKHSEDTQRCLDSFFRERILTC